MTSNNPFLDMDFTKMLQDYKFPGVDMEKVLSSQQKNIEALTKANQVAFEGAQAIARRQSDIMRQMMEEMSKMTRDIMDTNQPQDRMTKQAEVVKAAFENSLKNMKEISEMAAKSNTEAFDLINKRIGEVLDEFQTIVNDVQKNMPKAVQ